MGSPMSHTHVYPEPRKGPIGNCGLPPAGRRVGPHSEGGARPKAFFSCCPLPTHTTPLTHTYRRGEPSIQTNQLCHTSQFWPQGGTELPEQQVSFSLRACPASSKTLQLKALCLPSEKWCAYKYLTTSALSLKTNKKPWFCSITWFL